MSSSKSSDTRDAVAPVVLIVGTEGTLRDAALAEIRTRVLGDATPEFNEDRFDLASRGADPARILTAARTLPVFAKRRLVIVRGISDRRAKRFIEVELLEYLEDPVPTTCLLLEAEKVDRRLQWVKQVVKRGELIACAGPRRPSEQRAWIEARLRARGKRPSGGMAAALLELVGGDLDSLASELDKVCLYVGERAEVSPDDVAEVTGQLRPRALYELTDAIGQRQLGASLRTLGQLLDQGEPALAMLGALAHHFRRLMRVHECRPLEAGEVQRQLSLHPYAAQKLVEQARRFDGRRLRSCFAAIRRTDEALKGGVSVSPRIAIERLVLAVCS